MDSLTQIVLGAAVGEAVLGKHIGNKAMLYGAIAGTIPDLDVFTSHFTNTATALSIHRGITHSLLFAIIFGPLCGIIVSHFENYKHIVKWSLLFFLGFLTHALLDIHTTWGTQFFWPLPYKIALQTIFVIDPLYTLPFLICLLLAMFQNRTSKKRRFYTTLGLSLSSAYLILTYGLKWLAFQQFEQALQMQNITYLQLDTRPAPLNTILWNANVETEDAYLLGQYSFFDTQPITFNRFPKNHHLIKAYLNDKSVQNMINITNGWYTITKENGSLYFNDLRFGLYDMSENSTNFVFKYLMVPNTTNNEVEFIEAPKTPVNGPELLTELWLRVKGN